MPERSVALSHLLNNAGWSGAEQRTLAGDASKRRYIRLTRASGESAILMDAPPESAGPVRSFMRIANHLAGLGYSTPAIMAADEAAGYLLLEDFGDAVFTRAIAACPAAEPRLYRAAIDLLVDLHRHPAPAGVIDYGPERLASFTAPAFEWYRAGVAGLPAPRPAPSSFAPLLRRLAEALAPETPVLALRDYHAENLVWLAQRRGIARVGLLDFQDAVAAHPAYDVISLLHDIRHEIAPPLRERMLARYLRATGSDEGRFSAAAALLGAQRNLRILGVFARLCLRDGKQDYLALLPRVWARMEESLAHPALAELRSAILSALPAPTEPRLQTLRARCQTAPKP